MTLLEVGDKPERDIITCGLEHPGIDGACTYEGTRRQVGAHRGAMTRTRATSAGDVDLDEILARAVRTGDLPDNDARYVLQHIEDRLSKMAKGLKDAGLPGAVKTTEECAHLLTFLIGMTER